MARTQVVTVRVERQPHHDAVLRVRVAYRRLRRMGAQASVSNPLDWQATDQLPSQIQEVDAWSQ